MIDGKFYLPNDLLYYCPDKYPIIVTAVTSDSIPIADTAAVWTKIKGTIDVAYGDHSVIRITNTIPTEFEVDFKPGPKMKLTIRPILGFNIDETKSSKNRKYSFDDNKIKEYPYFGDAKPHKFIAYSKSDSITIKRDGAEHKNKFKMATFKPLDKFDYTITDPSNPIVNLKHKGVNTIDSIYWIACDTIKLAKIDVYPEKTLHVNIYTLAETDDDLANYCVDKVKSDPPYTNAKDVDGSLMADCVTKINSASFECIDRGPDGSLDLFNSTIFYSKKENNTSKAIDSIPPTPNQNHLRKIYAGSDKFCNVRPLRGTKEYKGSRDTASYPIVNAAAITTIQNNLNTIYNQVGISVLVHNKGVRFTNFDCEDDNNAIDKNGNASIEQNYVQVMFKGGTVTSPNISDTTTVFLADSMVSVYGRGPAYNSVTIDYRAIIRDNNERTIAHEIGHSKFKLYHPDDDPVGSQLNGISSLVIDKKNFMISGPKRNIAYGVKDYIFRKYQWKIVHK